MRRLYTQYDDPDPPLTVRGRNEDCKLLSEHLQREVPIIKDVGLILTSPSSRTLQTTEIALGFLIQKDIPVIPLAQLQETTDGFYDIGKSPEELKNRYPDYDWSQLDPVFPLRTGMYECSQDAILERGAWVRKWLADRKEKVIVVVSHVRFMRLCLAHRAFSCGDYRIFDLEDASDSEMKGPKLVEWDATHKSGGGMGKTPSGFFGWRISDFEAMRGNEGKTDQELEKMVKEAPLR